MGHVPGEDHAPVQAREEEVTGGGHQRLFLVVWMD